MATTSNQPKSDPPAKLDYAGPGTTATRSPSPIRYFVLLGMMITFIVLGLTVPVPRRGHTNQKFVYCMSRLRQIGIGVIIYTTEHEKCPPTLGALLPYVGSAEAFVCPSTNCRAAIGTPAQIAGAVDTNPACCSFIYLAAGKTSKELSPTFVIAHEQPGNHPQGVNMVFGDGHVESINPAKAKLILGELQAGFNPPRAQVVGQ